jgi:hypothetical protein
VKELCKRRSFEWSDFLPRERPTIFQYNFEFLDLAMSPDVQKSIERTNGVRYLIESISPTIAPIILPYLQSLSPALKLEFGQLVLETVLKCLPSLTALESKDTFTALVGYVASIAKLDESHIVFP